MTTQTIEERCKALEDECKELRKKATKTQKYVGEMNLAMSLLDEKKATRQFADVKERLAMLSKRLEVEILKDVVLSEVTRIYPETWRHLVKSLDKDDDWWKEGSELTIKQWRARVAG